MLASLTSREIAEWRAYELLNGPVGPSYEQNALASIHEMVQQLCRIMISVNSEEGSSGVPDIIRYPRPDEFLRQTEEE